ncbi:hypothetical protein D3C76_1269070 [compost metagenome]
MPGSALLDAPRKPMPREVLPMPDGPITRVTEERGKPPPTSRSSFAIPLGTRLRSALSGRDGWLKMLSRRGYTTRPSPVISNSCKPDNAALPRVLRS